MPVEGCIQLSLFGKTSLELCYRAINATILPYSNPLRAPRFQCLILDTGQTPEWCEGDGVIWHGVSWTPSIGRSPNSRAEKESLLWQILQDSVPQRYYLTPGQCTRILGFAARVGCPPPKIIEALLLKQGGRYPLSTLLRIQNARSSRKPKSATVHPELWKTHKCLSDYSSVRTDCVRVLL